MKNRGLGEKFTNSAIEVGINTATGLGPLKLIEHSLGVPEKARPSKLTKKAVQTSRKVGASALRKIREKSKESK